MRTVLRLYIGNIIILIIFLFGNYYDKIKWFSDFIMYFILIMGIFVVLSAITSDSVYILYKQKLKKLNIFYTISSWFFDVIFLLLFAYYDYKIMFAVYVINEFLTYILKQKIKTDIEQETIK